MDREMVSHHTRSTREAQHVLNVQAFAGSVAPLAVCSLAGLADDGAHGQCEIFDDIDAGSTVSYIQIDSAWRSKLHITRTVCNSWTPTSSMKPLDHHWVHSSKALQLFSTTHLGTYTHVDNSNNHRSCHHRRTRAFLGQRVQHQQGPGPNASARAKRNGWPST